MSPDDFTEAARDEAEDYARTPRMNVGTVRDRIGEAHLAGAVWGREQALAQEPTDAEVGALQKCLYDRTLTWVPTVEARAALSAAYAVRRDEEER